MKTIKEFDFKNKRALVRCDFNVPLSQAGDILDDFKIRQALPTIKYLIESGAEIILMSHLGDPHGKFVKELSMAPVSKRLNEILQTQVTLLENLRFNPGEESNDKNFAKELAQKGDIYVNDAFAVCHRKHASLCAITKYLPSCAGLLLEKEVEALGKLKKNPQRPLVVIIGGTKVETKVEVMDEFAKSADFILVSGLIQKQIIEKKLKFKHKEKIIFPSGDLEAFDINQETIEVFRNKILGAKTIFWNGPLGRIEEEIYQAGTKAVVRAIIDSGAFSVVGGGETVDFIGDIGLVDKFSHVSTGGGAMLAFIAGEKMPGIKALG
jgi:3-phosphoglycerate kinase